MSIKKTIKFTTGNITLPPTNSSHVDLPLGEKPEGDLGLELALDRLGETIQSLLKNMYCWNFRAFNFNRRYGGKRWTLTNGNLLQ